MEHRTQAARATFQTLTRSSESHAPQHLGPATDMISKTRWKLEAHIANTLVASNACSRSHIRITHNYINLYIHTNIAQQDVPAIMPHAMHKPNALRQEDTHIHCNTPETACPPRLPRTPEQRKRNLPHSTLFPPPLDPQPTTSLSTQTTTSIPLSATNPATLTRTSSKSAAGEAITCNTPITFCSPPPP